MSNRFLRIAAVVAASAALAATAALPTRKSVQAGVTVAVTPVSVAADAAWQFRVSLDTHSQELTDDLAASAVLLDGHGGEFRPSAWEGAQPGGHHRSGVLRFEPIVPAPQAIELRIARPGEAAPRSFRWALR